jgi:hypothetical protein
MRVCLAILAIVAAAMSVPVAAHHSFAMFDTSSQLSLSGVVSSFEWTNPHAYIELDVTDAKGAVKHWSIELGSPSILMRAGWKFKDVKPGDKISVVISPLKSGMPGGLLSRVTLADGRVLANGGPPPGRGQP